jgi:hypothetical protein
LWHLLQELGYDTPLVIYTDDAILFNDQSSWLGVALQNGVCILSFIPNRNPVYLACLTRFFSDEHR